MAQLDMEWKIIGKDYKLKVKSVFKDREANIDEYMKKNFLKFTLHIQKVFLFLLIYDYKKVRHLHHRTRKNI